MTGRYKEGRRSKAMQDTAPTEVAGGRNFAFRLTFDSPLGLTPELGRLGTGLSLSAFYGLALGTRSGGAELLRNALGVPLVLFVLGAVMLPSLTVLFAIVDAPVTPGRVLATLGRALSSIGLVLAGLAPGVALLCVTVESAELATRVARYGFVLAGGLALAGLWASFASALADAPPNVSKRARALLVGYSIFAIMLAARLFSAFVPMLGGRS
jgi:hypothetical protein